MAATANNKKCPVCDYDVDATAKVVSVGGRSVRVCCDDCEKKLKTNAKKYLPGR